MVSFGKAAGSLFWLATIAAAQTPVPSGMTTVIRRPAETQQASTPTSSVPSEVLPTPTMYTLDSTDPDCAQPPGADIAVERSGDKSVEQAVVFRGIPAEAKECRLSWKQADEAERHFEVAPKNGQTKMVLLDGFPAEGEPVTYNSLHQYEDDTNATSYSPDFTAWTDYGAWEHPQGSVPCAEAIYFRVAINADAGDGFVRLDQDVKNGFYISYTL